MLIGDDYFFEDFQGKIEILHQNAIMGVINKMTDLEFEDWLRTEPIDVALQIENIEELKGYLEDMELYEKCAIARNVIEDLKKTIEKNTTDDKERI